MSTTTIHPDNPLLGTQSRSDFIVDNIPLVHDVARHYFTVARRARVEYDDLVSEGTIGLMYAYDRYNRSDLAFSTYAYKCVRGHVLNFLYHQGGDVQVKIPFRLRIEALRIRRMGWGDLPIEELAAKLGVTKARAEDALIASEITLRNIDARNGRGHLLFEPSADADTTLPEIAEFLDALPVKQANILRYLEAGYSQADIARETGVSKQAVGQAVARIRKHYEKYEEAA